MNTDLIERELCIYYTYTVNWNTQGTAVHAESFGMARCESELP